MTPLPWLTGQVVRSPSGLLVKEATARLRETRRRWWAAVPWWLRITLAALLLPWLVVAALAYLEFGWVTAEWLHNSRVFNFLMPKV